MPRKQKLLFAIVLCCAALGAALLLRAFRDQGSHTDGARNLLSEQAGCLPQPGSAESPGASTTREEDSVQDSTTGRVDGTRLGSVESARPILRTWLRLLEHDDKYIRRMAAKALAELIAPHDRAVVEFLAQALNDEDEIVRQWVAIALGKVPANIPEILPHLESIPGTEDCDMAEETFQALRRVVPVNPSGLPLLFDLMEKNHGLYEKINKAIVSLPWNADTVPFLLDEISRPDGSRRNTACTALIAMGPRSIPFLLERLKGEPDALAWTCEICHEFGEEARDAVPQLMNALRAGGTQDRRWAAHALADIGPAAGGVIPEILAWMEKDSRRLFQPSHLLKLVTNPAPFVQLMLDLLQKGGGILDTISLDTLPVRTNDDLVYRALVEIAKNQAAGTGPHWLDPAFALQALGKQSNQAGQVLLTALQEATDHSNQYNLLFAFQPMAARFPGAAPCLREIVRKTWDIDLQKCALASLVAMGPAAEGASPGLTDELLQRYERNPEHLSSYLLAALAAIAPERRETLQILSRVLYQDEEDEYVETLDFGIPFWNLVKSVVSRPEAIPYLVEEFAKMECFYWARPSIHILVAHGKRSIPALTSALSDSRTRVRLYAIRALEQMGTLAAPTRDALRARLSDDDAAVRFYTARVLAGLGEETNTLLPAVIGSIDSDKGDAAENGIRFLGLLGTDAREVLPRFIEMLVKDKYGPCPESVARIGWNSPETIEALIQGLRREGWHLDGPRTACRILASLGRRALPHLVRNLGHTDTKIRARVCMAIGWMGLDAQSAIPQLAIALRDPESIVSRKAAQALGRMGTAGIPHLVRALKAGSPEIQRSALQGLSTAGKSGAPARTAVLELAGKSKDKNVLVGALHSLKSISPSPADDLASLIPGLPTASLQGEAVVLLAELSPEKAVSFTKHLLFLLDREEHRRTAFRAIYHMGPHAKPLLPMLWRLYHKAGTRERRNILRYVVSIEPDSPAVESLIVGMLQSKKRSIHAEGLYFEKYRDRLKKWRGRK